MNQVTIIWTIVSIILCTCAIVATTAYCIYKFKGINLIKHDLELSASQIAERAKRINEEAKILHQARMVNEQLLNDLMYKENGTRELIDHNKKIIELNKDVLRKSSVEIFAAKEANIYLYSHYERLIDLIDQVLSVSGDEERIEQLYAVQETAKYNLSIVSNNFVNTFNMTVEQYIDEKNNIVSKKPDGSSHITPFSKN